MIFIRILAYVLLSFGLVGTLLPLLRYDDYWIRMWDYPRVQLTVILLIGLTLLGVGYRTDTWPVLAKAALMSGVFAIAFQVYRILPYTRVWPKQVVAASADEATKDYSRLHLLVSNVLQDNDEHERLLNLVAEEEPDVLLTLETNRAWQHSLEEGLHERYQHRVEVPMENRYGMHLWSSLPLRNSQIKHLISDSIPSIHTEVQLDDGAWIKLYCLHPTPPSPTEESASTGRDAELALVGEIVTEVGNRNTVVAGDLNDVAWSHSTRLFKRLSGLLDPRQGRGLFNTFHADHWWARWPLDHVFHSTEFQVTDMRVLRNIGSDHFPVSVKLQHVPEEANLMEEPTKEGDDKQEADKTIETAKAGEVDGLIIQE